MNTIPNNTLIIAVLMIAITIAVVAWFIVRRQRSLRRKQRFGSEYDLTVTEFRSRARSEEEILKWQRERFAVAADKVATPPPTHRIAVHS